MLALKKYNWILLFVFLLLGCNREPSPSRPLAKNPDNIQESEKTIFYIYQPTKKDSAANALSINKSFNELEKITKDTIGTIIDSTIGIKRLNLYNIKNRKNFIDTLSIKTTSNYLFIFMLNKSGELSYKYASDINLLDRGTYTLHDFSQDLDNLKKNKIIMGFNSIVCIQNGKYDFDEGKDLDTILKFPKDHSNTTIQSKNLNLLFSNRNDEITVINSLGLGYVSYINREANHFIRGLSSAIRSGYQYEDLYSLLQETQTRHNYYYIKTRLANNQLKPLAYKPKELQVVKNLIKRIFTLSKTEHQEPIPSGISINGDKKFVELNEVLSERKMKQEAIATAINYAEKNKKDEDQKVNDTLKHALENRLMLYVCSLNACQVTYNDTSNNEKTIKLSEYINSLFKKDIRSTTDPSKITVITKSVNVLESDTAGFIQHIRIHNNNNYNK